MNKDDITAEIQKLSPMTGDILMVGLKKTDPLSFPTGTDLQAWLELLNDTLYDKDMRIIVYVADSVRSITHIHAGDTDGLVQALDTTT